MRLYWMVSSVDSANRGLMTDSDRTSGLRGRRAVSANDDDVQWVRHLITVDEREMLQGDIGHEVTVCE